MKKALMVAYGGGHVAALVPVIRELERRGGWAVTILGCTTAGPALRKAGIPTLGFRDLIGPGDEAALEAGKRLLGPNHSNDLGIPPEESVAYLGLSYRDLEERLGPEEAARRYAASGRQAFLPLGPVERLIRSLGPDIVVTTNSPRAEEAAIRVAGRLGVPSLCVVDLLFPEGLFEDDINAFVAEPGFASRLAVFSEPFREWLVGHGRRPEEVVATGNPQFDELTDPALPARALALRAAKGWEGKKLVLWASQPEPRQPQLTEGILKALLAAVGRHPDWHLIHRKHPSEPVQTGELPAWATRSDSRDELALQLSAVDAVVTMTSTVGIQGVLRDKPLVKVRLSEFDKTMPYESLGVALTVDRLDQLEERLIAALSDGPEARELRSARGRLKRPGAAAKEVADLIERMVP